MKQISKETWAAVDDICRRYDLDFKTVPMRKIKIKIKTDLTFLRELKKLCKKENILNNT